MKMSVLLLLLLAAPPTLAVPAATSAPKPAAAAAPAPTVDTSQQNMMLLEITLTTLQNLEWSLYAQGLITEGNHDDLTSNCASLVPALLLAEQQMTAAAPAATVAATLSGVSYVQVNLLADVSADTDDASRAQLTALVNGLFAQGAVVATAYAGSHP